MVLSCCIVYLVSFEGGKLKLFTSILFVQDLKTTVIGNLRNWTCSDKSMYYGLHIALLQNNNCLLPSLFRPPRKRLNSIHSRLTPALTCGFNQVYSFSQSSLRQMKFLSSDVQFTNPYVSNRTAASAAIGLVCV